MQNTNPEIEKLKLNIQSTVETLQKRFGDLKTEILYAFGVPAIVSLILGFLITIGAPLIAGVILFTLLFQLMMAVFSAYWIFRFSEKLYALETVGSYDGYSYEKSKNRLTNYFLVCAVLGALCVVGAGAAGLPTLAVVVFLPLCPFVTMFQNANVFDSLKIGFDLTEGNRVHLLFVNLVYLVAIGALAFAFKSVGSALASVFMLGYITGLLNLYIKASSVQVAKL